jgi:ubiquinone/menaquinone biosynthesis C-methylase UbiE
MARVQYKLEYLERGSIDDCMMERLIDVFRLSPDDVCSQLDCDLLRYFPELFAEPLRVRSIASVVASFFSMANWKQGCTILDVGCGFGLEAICMRAIGARRVAGLDVSEGKIQTARRIASMIESDVQFVQGDTLVPFEDGAFDGILIKDALSHLTEDDPFLAEAARVLSPQGTLLIIDDRNALSPMVQWKTRRLWRTCEFGSLADMTQLGLTSNYFSIRLEHLARIAPDLPQEDREHIARRTRGYTNEQLPQFVESIPKGTRPSLRKAPCINPANGMVQERLLNPLGLCSNLNRRGFKASIRPFSGRRIVTALWPLTLPLTSSFCVIGEKLPTRQFTKLNPEAEQHR